MNFKLKKTFWFWLAGSIIPVVTLVVIEFFLRIFNVGHNTQLFVSYPPDNNYYVLNEFCSIPFFDNPVNATKGYVEPFPKVKGDAIRLFVVGESTTEGYPYFHNGSFHRWLKYRLSRTFPDKDFEIINISLTAINSFAVRDFARQLAKYKPDGILIYVGHNEYYGGLGVGASNRTIYNRLLVRLIIEIRKFRIGQVLQSLVMKFKTKESNKKIDLTKNLMERMVRKNRIPYNSEDFRKAVKYYKQNMDDICQYFESKNIPLFISTIVSNEKDLPPFISNDQSMFNADSCYSMGRKYYQRNHFINSKKDFLKAIDYDELRFRAPTELNDIILGLSRYKNVHLVRTRSEFEDFSPHRILGDELILDHVHPNLKGYGLMSDAFYKSILKSGILPPIEHAYQMSFEELSRAMPVSCIDSLSGAFSIMMLEANWPFNKSIPSNFKIGDSLCERLSGKLSVGKMKWVDAEILLYQHYISSGDLSNAYKIIQGLLLEYPLEEKYARLSFDLATKLNDVPGIKLYSRLQSAIR